MNEQRNFHRINARLSVGIRLIESDIKSCPDCSVKELGVGDLASSPSSILPFDSDKGSMDIGKSLEALHKKVDAIIKLGS